VQPSLLDTISKSMTLEVASTKYGSLLTEYVEELTKQ
jgi:hypothetical protein